MKTLALNIALLCAVVHLFAQDDSMVTGITLVAPRDSFQSHPAVPLQTINCQWVAVVPYAFTPNNESKVFYGNGHQWWGETPDGARHTIQILRESGMKVMLKPQLWIHNSWVGALDFDNERSWEEWESDYRDYILEFAHIAQENNVEIFCIGTEFKISVRKRLTFWRQLIKDVKKVYSGKLTYCSNWDDFEEVPFWKELDYIGVSAYFPLSEEPTPSVELLMEKWKPIKKRLSSLSAKTKKKVLFTEYGYLSVDGCAGKTWELEKVRSNLNLNELAQSNALEAIYKSFCDEEFWVGGFLWKWYSHDFRQKYRSNDYTPQGKMAEQTISRWFSEMNEQQTKN